MNMRNLKRWNALHQVSALGVWSIAIGIGIGSANAAPKATPDRGQTIHQSSPKAPAPTPADLFRQIVRSMETTDVSNAGFLPGAPTDADYRPVDPAMAELGKLLYHDKLLSGNMNISCATCHNMLTETSDGLSLPIGEGGGGLGPTRDTGFGIDAIHGRVPRHAPHIFNLGAYEFTTMMHDGRIAEDPNHPGSFLTPAGSDFIPGIESAVAAQACFPVVAGAEMAGQPGENKIADAAANGDLMLAWKMIAKRVAYNPEYLELFMNVYPNIQSGSDPTYAHIANAIAAYEFATGRADNSPFDQFLRGDSGAMSMNATRGMILFYGKASCVDCHSGSFQTSQGFAAIGLPQIGPGKGHNQPGYSDGHDDLGLGAETGDPADNFKFRIPSLRNVALTGPYGHDGAFATLEAMVRHHLDPLTSMFNYDQSQAVLPYRDDLSAQDMVVMNDTDRMLGILAANELNIPALSEAEIQDLLDFLHALTDTRSIDLRHAIPMRVPSGLPVFD